MFRRLALSIIRISVIVVAVLFLMFSGLVDHLLYYPMPYPQGNWDAQAAASAQDVWLTTKDGVRLNAWWFSMPDARFATLFLHGNAGNVTHRIDHAQAIRLAGSAVLVVDYRGYGKSKGRPSERGLYEDADAGYDELIRRGYSASRIIVQGESLGTAVAAELAARRPCAGVIFESPFASLSQMASKVVPVVGSLVAHGFDTDKRIEKVHVPLLIIHGDADEIVPFSQGEAVFRKANQPKTFWRVSGAHHNDLLYVAGKEYVGRLRGFYRLVGAE